jgi:hypothetical protein
MVEEHAHDRDAFVRSQIEYLPDAEKPDPGKPDSGGE